MAKPKAPEENTDQNNVSYETPPDNKNTQGNNTPDKPKAPEENKTPEDVAKEFAKPYKDKDGNYWENGLQKFYIIVKDKKQIEKNGKLVFEKDGIECPYYENLLPAEVKRRKEKGEIF